MDIASFCVPGLLHQLETLKDAEAVLLVNDDEAQLCEFNFLLDQGVGSDHQLRAALSDVAADLALAVVLKRAGEKHNSVSRRFKDAARRKIMLLGENLGRRHQRNLVSVLDGDNRGLECDERFARAYVALKQAAHRERLLHIGSDFFQRTFLGSGGMEREYFLDGLADLIFQVEGDSGLCFLLATLEFES